MLRLLNWIFCSYSLYGNIASFLLIKFPQFSYRIWSYSVFVKDLIQKFLYFILYFTLGRFGSNVGGALISADRWIMKNSVTNLETAGRWIEYQRYHTIWRNLRFKRNIYIELPLCMDVWTLKNITNMSCKVVLV